MYRRRHDWGGRLGQVILDASTREWRWGVHDCCAFVVDCILAQRTGLDLPPRLADYLAADDPSEDDADGLLREFDGVEGIALAVAKANGFAEVSWRLAQRGDIVLVRGREDNRRSNECALGVVDTSGQRVAIADGVGLRFVRLREGYAVRAWRI